MNFAELSAQRYSLRKFSDRPVEDALLQQVLEAGRNAPTAHNNQPQRIFVLQSPEAMAKADACMGCHFHPPVLLAVAYDPAASWKRETDGKDQTHIASVIYNRLEKPNSETVCLLQIDATLVYALGRQISQADYTADTPYNTYTNQGLPPGPIASPGMVALNSALNPASTNDYYYVLGNDGAHHFFRTHQGQLDFIAQQAAAAKN